MFIVSVVISERCRTSNTSPLWVFFMSQKKILKFRHKTAAKFYHQPSPLYVGQTVHHVGD